MKTQITPYIITLTGSSLSGKSYIVSKIIEAKLVLENDDIFFNPIPIPKYTTRTYREEDITKKRTGEFVDVIPVDKIPEKCDLVYRTYGKDYGLQTEELRYSLCKNKTPIVVINDIRAVEELKTLFPGRVLSLYVYRRIPNVKDYEKAKENRGNAQMQEYIDRYHKSISMYRVYIENITIFDRVILNVRDYKGFPDEIDYTRMQIINLLRGLFNGKMKLEKRKTKAPHLFIISGSAASGKDHIIQAVRNMGRLQAVIIPKYTSRRQADDDGDEMICRLIPKQKIISQYQTIYDNMYAIVTKKYNEYFNEIFRNRCRRLYIESGSTDHFSDYCEVQWEMEKLNELKSLEKPLDSFWKKMRDTLGNKSEDVVLAKLFQINIDYIFEIDDLVKPSLTMKAWEVNLHGDDYIVYENNKNSIRYGFKTSALKDDMYKDSKHRLLVASLPEIFRMCSKRLPKGRIVPIYTYSQIDKDDYLECSDPTMAEMKEENLDDLSRYSEYITDFKHVLIYATTSMKNDASGVKEELIDQMFRLFRAY